MKRKLAASIFVIGLMIPVAGADTLAPDGTYVGGKPELAPDGSYVGEKRK